MFQVSNTLVQRAKDIHGTIVPKDDYGIIADAIIDKLWRHDGKLTLRHLHGSWWQWEGRVYREMSGERLAAKVRTWLEGAKTIVTRRLKDETEVKTEVMMKPTLRMVSEVLAAMSARCQLPTDDLPVYLGRDLKPRNLLSLTNGLLDIESYMGGNARLVPHDPDWVSLNALDFAFDPAATCPLWDAFIADVMSGDQECINTLQEWMGLNLVHDMSHHAVMLLIGSGRNGKGVFLRTMMALVGEGNYCSPTFSSICGNFGLQSWIGKQSAIFPDFHLGKHADSIRGMEVLKTISGGDPISVDRKNKTPLDLHLSARISIAANELPRFPDAATAIGKRMIIIPFHQSYEGKEDRDLDDKLRAELPGILLWALKGLERLRLRGRFLQPDAGLTLKKDFDHASSPIHAFVDEYCEVGSGLDVRKETLRIALNQFLDDSGHNKLSDVAITAKLRAVSSKIETARMKRHGRQDYYYSGITLRRDAYRELCPNVVPPLPPIGE